MPRDIAFLYFDFYANGKPKRARNCLRIAVVFGPLDHVQNCNRQKERLAVGLRLQIHIALTRLTITKYTKAKAPEIIMTPAWQLGQAALGDICSPTQHECRECKNRGNVYSIQSIRTYTYIHFGAGGGRALLTRGPRNSKQLRASLRSPSGLTFTCSTQLNKFMKILCINTYKITTITSIWWFHLLK